MTASISFDPSQIFGALQSGKGSFVHVGILEHDRLCRDRRSHGTNKSCGVSHSPPTKHCWKRTGFPTVILSRKRSSISGYRDRDLLQRAFAETLKPRTCRDPARRPPQICRDLVIPSVPAPLMPPDTLPHPYRSNSMRFCFTLHVSLFPHPEGDSVPPCPTLSLLVTS